MVGAWLCRALRRGVHDESCPYHGSPCGELDTPYVVTRSRPYPCIINSVLDSALYAVIDSVIYSSTIPRRLGDQESHAAPVGDAGEDEAGTYEAAEAVEAGVDEGAQHDAGEDHGARGDADMAFD